jgi:hypothetical protein
MAFTVIPEPDMEKANPDEWRVLVQDLEVFSLGLLSVEVENMNTDGVPRILGVIEVNGRKFRRDSFDGVSGSPAAGAYNFIYAVPSEDEMTLAYSSSVPAWSAGKGGWYSGNNRAIARLFYAGGNYYEKVILDNYSAMYAPTMQDGVTTGGTSVAIPGYLANKKNTYRFNLPAGAYRYSLASGAGAGNASGSSGGVASTRDTRTGTFVWHGGGITIRTGGDGFNGGNGGFGTLGNGYGGGSGAGEKSKIANIVETFRISAGTSGSGQKEGFSGLSFGDNEGQGGGFGFGGGGNGGATASANYISYGGGSGDKGGHRMSEPANRGGSSNYGSNGENGSSNGGSYGVGNGGAGGAPGWQRQDGDNGGSCSLWRLW